MMMNEPIHLLLIEDDPDDRLLIQEMLWETMGRSVTLEYTTTLKEGRNRLQQQKFDLILLDLSLPDCQGLETFLAVRQAAPRLPIIVLTGLSNEKLALQAMREGAQDYLMKDWVHGPLLSRAIRYAIERKQVEQILQWRIEMEETVAAISTTFINLPLDAIDENIDATLETIGSFVGVDRSYIFLFEDDGRIENIYSWCAPEIEPHHWPFEELTVDQFPWLIEQIKRSGVFFIEQIAQLPPPARVEKQYWQKQNIQSVLIVPMVYGGALMGFLEFDSVQRERLWSDQQITLLQIVGEVITNALARKQAQARLQYLARHDSLTGLPNRTVFVEKINRAIQRAKEEPDYLFAVLLIDLNRFKLVNDSLGHRAGNQLLMTVARRLTRLLSATDHMVARLTGDEFILFLDNIQDAEEAIRWARDIQNALARPIEVAGQPILTTASIGIAVNSPAYTWVEDIIRDADRAMYQAKTKGYNQPQLFEGIRYDDALARLQMQTDLHQAIEQNELRLYYQPIGSLTTGEITALEALLRWQHPRRGLIGPDQFIPLAEEIHLMADIDRWVLRTACAQTKKWYNQGHKVHIAVNVSADLLHQPDCLPVITEVLAQTGLPPAALHLEISERATLRDIDLGAPAMKELADSGVQISLDDFGTSYSSLKHLRALPLRILKIDLSFIANIGSDPREEAIVISIIELAHKLGLVVVAEGVETEAQLSFLQEYQCDEIQGFLLSRALPEPLITAFLQNYVPNIRYLLEDTEGVYC